MIGIAVAVGSVSSVHGQSTTLVSRASSGELSNGQSLAPWITPDGRYLAFASTGHNLVPGDTNGTGDIFIHDRLTGTTVRASVTSSGGEANGYSDFPSLADDGQRVAFVSAANNLLGVSSSFGTQVFLRDRQFGFTVLVSANSMGQAANSFCTFPSISGDGRFVLFHSGATNLVPGDTNAQWDTFVRDTLLGTTTRISVSSSGAQANGSSGSTPARMLSLDGRFAVFQSYASNLVVGDTNQGTDIFLHDLHTSSTTRVSVGLAGAESNGGCDTPSISSDGLRIAFTSGASNLVPGDSNQAYDVFVFDVLTGQTTRANVDSTGAQSSLGTSMASISPDGRAVGFQTAATDLAAGDPEWFDFYLHDLQTGVTARVSVDSNGGAANGDAGEDAPSVANGGRFVAFMDWASNLVPDDGNDSVDVFVRDTQACEPTIATYCTAGTSSHGCVATLSTSGTPSASAGSGFVVTAHGVDGQRDGLVFYGVDGPAVFPWSGTNAVCVRPPLQRTHLQTSGGNSNACDGQLTLDWNQFVATHSGPSGTTFSGGETVWLQAWVRDPQSPFETVLTGGVWFQVCP